MLSAAKNLCQRRERFFAALSMTGFPSILNGYHNIAFLDNTVYRVFKEGIGWLIEDAQGCSLLDAGHHLLAFNACGVPCQGERATGQQQPFPYRQRSLEQAGYFAKMLNAVGQVGHD